MSKNDHQFAAFTLIELLVVITIIAGLLAIVVPLMTRVKERVRRTLCQNNIRLFFTGIYIYAYDHQQLLPSDFPNERINHTPALTPQCRDAIINRIGHNKILECPSLGGYEGVGYIIGYNYLGGTPKPHGQPIPDTRSGNHLRKLQNVQLYLLSQS
jgi:prepilin-type N-terminal cleavage/methylation domain-containing protein